MAENIINKNLSGFTKEMLDMTYPDEYYKNTIQPAKAGTGPVPSKMQMFSKFQPGKAMMIGMDPYLPGFMQQGYDKFRAAPTQAVKNIAGTLGKGITSLASLPAQAAMFTLGSTPANADEANMSPEDFAALAEAEGMTYGSSPITSSPINPDERYADQLAPGAYGKMGENVYTKMDDGSTRMDPYASQKFYDDRMFNDYFATNRYEDFNPRVGNMSTSTPQMGDAISRTNVQGMDYEMDPGAFMNPNIQPSQNMFQLFGGAVKGGLESLRNKAGSIADFIPFIGDKSLTGMAMQGLGKVGKGIGNFFQGNPEQRARNEYNKQFSTGDIYGYGMGSASGANKDAFGYNTVSAFGNYEQHMIDTIEKLEDLLEKTGRTGFKPGTPNFNKLNTYTKSINKIQEDNRTKKEEAQKALERELAKYAAQNRIYGSGGGRDESLNRGPGGSYTGRGDVGATTANQRGDFATDSLSYDLKDGGPVGLASMFTRRG